MAAANPYIEEVKYKPATKKYKITFLPSGKSIEVDRRNSLRPQRLPQHSRHLRRHQGRPDHACGGVCACSTCHVIVQQGLESCNEATDAELDELDEAPGITRSRASAAKPFPTAPRTSSLNPEWNKTTPRNSIINSVAAGLSRHVSWRSLCPRC